MSKTKEKKIDFNSPENQRIKSDFVSREGLVLFSYPMIEIIKKGLISWEDFENLSYDICEACGEPIKLNNDGLYECQYCNEKSEYCGSEMQDIYEHWLVTEYLYNKLKEKGEPVVEWHNLYIWGRCCTGQAILLDSVLSEICSEMEILDGQKYSWNKK